MDCKNHPGVPAHARCAGCAEEFCFNCLVNMNGQHYCGSCKVLGIRGRPVVEEGTLPCKEAREALTYALVGLLCIIILEPLAIAKALEARRKLAMNPNLTGWGKATAALVIAISLLTLWVLGMAAHFSHQSIP